MCVCVCVCVIFGVSWWVEEEEKQTEGLFWFGRRGWRYVWWCVCVRWHVCDYFLWDGIIIIHSSFVLHTHPHPHTHTHHFVAADHVLVDNHGCLLGAGFKKCACGFMLFLCVCVSVCEGGNGEREDVWWVVQRTEAKEKESGGQDAKVGKNEGRKTHTHTHRHATIRTTTRKTCACMACVCVCERNAQWEGPQKTKRKTDHTSKHQLPVGWEEEA